MLLIHFYLIMWMICLNLTEGCDFDVLRRFVKLFETSPLSQAIRGYFLYNTIAIDDEEEDEDEEKEKEEKRDELEDVDPFDIVLVIILFLSSKL